MKKEKKQKKMNEKRAQGMTVYKDTASYQASRPSVLQLALVVQLNLC